MNPDDRDGDEPDSAGDASAEDRSLILAARRGLRADESSADADQSAADADQTHSDEDQTAAAADQTSADRDQSASDRDQATADREHAADAPLSPAGESAYDISRNERHTVSVERSVNRVRRTATARDRDETALRRDQTADERDETARGRDARLAALPSPSVESEAILKKQLELLAAQAAADRARATEDRARAARDRVTAAHERARLEAQLHFAHLDELTGVYRREMGRVELSHEIDRARRSDGRFVVAFIDVDGLKGVNDRDGHAAGDRVLQAVVLAMRMRLRSFDPIVRYGGDEFVCGLGGTDLVEAKRRFDAIGIAVRAEAHVGISVGLAALESGDTADELTKRADEAMLETRANERSH